MSTAPAVLLSGAELLTQCFLAGAGTGAGPAAGSAPGTAAAATATAAAGWPAKCCDRRGPSSAEPRHPGGGSTGLHLPQPLSQEGQRKACGALLNLNLGCELTRELLTSQSRTALPLGLWLSAMLCLQGSSQVRQSFSKRKRGIAQKAYQLFKITDAMVLPFTFVTSIRMHAQNPHMPYADEISTKTLVHHSCSR